MAATSLKHHFVLMSSFSISRNSQMQRHHQYHYPLSRLLLSHLKSKHIEMGMAMLSDDHILLSELHTHFPHTAARIIHKQFLSAMGAIRIVLLLLVASQLTSCQQRNHHLGKHLTVIMGNVSHLWTINTIFRFVKYTQFLSLAIIKFPPVSIVIKNAPGHVVSIHLDLYPIGSIECPANWNLSINN